MIKDPITLLLILLAVESVVLFLSTNRKARNLFNFLPAVFWIYFIPMLLSTFGLIDPKSPLYTIISRNVLPASLVLLLLGVDLRAISKLGQKAIVIMLAGSLGIAIAIPVVFYMFRDWVGREFWAGFGALSGSWIGGSANLIAVKEAIGAPEEVFLPMIVVDTIVPYVWMGCLVALAGLQPVFDRWVKAEGVIAGDFHENKDNKAPKKHSPAIFFLILMIAVLGSAISQQLALHLPQVKDIISTYAWTIIIVTTLGLGLSLTPLRQLERQGSTGMGYFLLYLVLTSIGAKASLATMGSAWILIIAGFFVVVIHFLILLMAARWLKAPLFLTAVASQANIGGVASAPIVAEIYKPGFASVGLLMAILGNIIGTYLGIIISQICRWVATLP